MGQNISGEEVFRVFSTLWDVSIRSSSIESVLIVSKFQDVFPLDLLGMPPNRDTEFYIDLEIRTSLTSIPPYKMALTELTEPKIQL